jgi:uncharacterized protein (TIGR02145 family)
MIIQKDRFNQAANMKYKIVNLFAIAFILTGLIGCKTNSLKDIDGNVYKTVVIGTQVWMKENLKTTRFNDGTGIPLVTVYDKWIELTTPSFCWYNNDSTNKKVYGALYNWYAVDTKKLCLEGWHVPDDSEWTELMNFLEKPEIVGNKLKETGTSHWKSPNSEANNESGFTALPGGFRSYNGSFNYQRIGGYWWSSTQYTDANVYFWNLRYKFGYVYRYISDKTNGFSVRCIKDQVRPDAH